MTEDEQRPRVYQHNKLGSQFFMLTMESKKDLKKTTSNT